MYRIQQQTLMMSKKHINYNIKETCCVCLLFKPGLKHIKDINDNNLTTFDQLQSFTKSFLEEYVTKDSSVCSECSKQIDEAYAFCQKCIYNLTVHKTRYDSWKKSNNIVDTIDENEDTIIGHDYDKTIDEYHDTTIERNHIIIEQNRNNINEQNRNNIIEQNCNNIIEQNRNSIIEQNHIIEWNRIIIERDRNVDQDFMTQIENVYDTTIERNHITETTNLTEVIKPVDDDPVPESTNIDPLEIIPFPSEILEENDVKIESTDSSVELNETSNETNSVDDIEINETKPVDDIEINETNSVDDIEINETNPVDDIKINETNPVDDIEINETNSVDDIEINESKVKVEDLGFETLSGETNPIALYNCTVCEEKLLYLTDSFLNHFKQHEPSKRLYVCFKCKLYFVTKYSQVRHFEKDHEENETICKVCGEYFKYKDGYKHHLKSHKSDVKTRKRNKRKKLKTETHKCCICRKSFLIKTELIIHLVGHYSINNIKKKFYRKRKVVCDICGKLTRFISQHRKNHFKANGTYTCRVCSVNFTDDKTCYKHETTEHSNFLYVCKVCGKGFEKVCSYKSHFRSHKDKRCRCEICGKNFSDSEKLELHNRIHLDDKRYECIICNKKFVQSYNLTIHKRIHTGETPYKCTECGMEYSFSSSYLQHMRTKHKANIPIIKKKKDVIESTNVKTKRNSKRKSNQKNVKKKSK